MFSLEQILVECKGKSMNEKYVKLSRFLCFVLRHHPEKIDIQIDKKGWCDIDLLINKANTSGKHINRKILNELVQFDSKQRYSISEDKKMIRCNQGHSINVDMEFKTLKPPDTLYHGTVERFLSDIIENGIKKMSRQYVHLSSEVNTATSVGKRRGEPVIISIDSKKMNENGILFYLSDNGVWLCEYVSPEYIVEYIK